MTVTGITRQPPECPRPGGTRLPVEAAPVASQKNDLRTSATGSLPWAAEKP